MIGPLFTSGHIAFLALAIMAAEVFYFRQHLARWPIILSGLGAGSALVLALRSALLQHSWTTIAAFLCISGLFHASETWQWHKLTRKT